MDVTKLYKCIWQDYINGCEKTILIDLKKLLRWMWQVYPNRFENTIQTNGKNSTNWWEKTVQLILIRLYKTMQMDLSILYKMHVTRLSKWKLQNYPNGCDRTIKIDVKKTYKNKCNKTIPMDITKLYK